MAQAPPPPPSSPTPAGGGEAARIARELAEALGMDVGDLPAPEASPPGAGTAGEAGRGPEGRLRLDKSGALLGLQKLKPVLAHGRADAEDAAAARTAERAAGEADAAAQPSAGGPKRATLPPRIGSYVPPGFPGAGAGDAADVEEVEIPGGRFLFGEEREPREVPAFRIDALPVTNAAYERFVAETGHRPPLYWPAGHLPDDLRDHPVVGVDYFDALAYARWLEKDLPFEDEWERAARGTDGRVWPWGNDGDQPHANTARSGFKCTLPVGFFPENVSPDGVKDLVGNVWELTHSPAPGGGIVVRGGSWYDLAYHAKAWFRFAARPTARNGTIGFRCVRRSDPRASEPREIDPAVLEAEIAARRGPQPPVDPSTFSADRRDLVPDLRRLRILVAERKAEQILSPLRSAPGDAGRHEPLVSATAAVVVPAPRGAAAAAPRAGAPAPAPEAAGEREHVTDERIPAARAAPSPAAAARAAARAALDAAAEAAARAQARAPAEAALSEAALAQAAARTPLALWVLLAAGFALLVGLLWIVLRGGAEPTAGGPGATDQPPGRSADGDGERPGPAGPSVRTELDDQPGLLPPFPAGGRAPLDGQPPRLLDGATGTWIERLREGPWLLVFAGGGEDAAALTRRTAHALHRRFDGRGVRVALVLPRRLLEQADGAVLAPSDLVASLEALEARDGMTVLLDPFAGGRDAIREARYGLESQNAAVLLVQGEIEAQTSPPTGGMDLKRLLPVARRAYEIGNPDLPAGR